MASRRTPYFSLLPPGDRTTPELDGLRGVAVLLVLFRHGTAPLHNPSHPFLAIGGWDVATPFLNGWLGVDLFFTLSGFLITFHLLTRWPHPFHRRFVYRFWLKRGLRVAPAYYGVLVIVALGFVPFYAPTVNRFDVSAHLLFLQDYFGAPIVVAFWSLGVEIKFYLLAPLFVGTLRSVRSPSLRRAALLLLSLTPLALRWWAISTETPETYFGFFWSARAPFHMALDGFWLGTLVAFLYREAGELPAPLKRKIGSSALLVGWVGIVMLLFPFDILNVGSWRLVAVYIYLATLSFALILLGALMNPTPVHRFLGSRSLGAVGIVSYSLYLVHQPLIPTTRRLIAWMGIPSLGDGAAYWGLFLPLLIAMSLLAALLLHFVLEKPFLRLKDRISMLPDGPLIRRRRGGERQNCVVTDKAGRVD